MDQPDRKIHTETDIEAYEEYLPNDWGEKTIGPIAEGTVLERLLLDLALSWRSASYTAMMPATSIPRTRPYRVSTMGKLSAAAAKLFQAGSALVSVAAPARVAPLRKPRRVTAER